MQWMSRSSLALVALACVQLATGASASATTPPTGTVNINTASAIELTQIPGIGPAKAQAIVAHRQQEKFVTLEDLTKVKGIGDKLLQKIQPFVRVSGPTTLQAGTPSAPSPTSMQ